MIQLKSKNVVFLFCLFVLVYSCTDTKTKEEYTEEVQKDEAYNKEVLMDGYRIKMGIRPYTFIALQELRNKKEEQLKKSFQKEITKFDNGVYLDFSISQTDGGKLIPRMVGTQEDYSFLIGQLNYMIKDNLVAYNSTDTIKALYCNYTNTYNNSNEIRLTYCFSKKTIDKTSGNDLCFEYIDAVFGIKDKVRLCFEKNKTLDKQVKLKDIDE